MEVQLTPEFILSERLHLYQQLWGELEKEEERLNTDFNIAMNMACAEWSLDLINDLVPSKILPNTMGLLRENFEMLRDQISRRRYYLTIAFYDVWSQYKNTPFGGVRTDRAVENFEYWDKQLHLSPQPVKKRKKAS